MHLPSPPWPVCGQESNASLSRERCRGIQVPGYSACLAHLTPEDRSAYLSTLRPADEIDFRGTTFSESLLSELVAALRELGSGPTFGEARFNEAVFSEASNFENVQFLGTAHFTSATFRFRPWFDNARFAQDAHFEEVFFRHRADFSGVIFAGHAWFHGATFTEGASFNRAVFEAEAKFYMARFTERSANFEDTSFLHAARFSGTHFEEDVRFLRAHFSDEVYFEGVKFSSAIFNDVRFEHDAQFSGSEFSGPASFSRTTFNGAATFSKPMRPAKFEGVARFAEVAFSDAAIFESVTFEREIHLYDTSFNKRAYFRGVNFLDTARFELVDFSAFFDLTATSFTMDLRFRDATFEAPQRIGPLACSGNVNFDHVVFNAPMTLEAAALSINFHRAQWESTASLRLRHAELFLDDSVLTHPLAVTAASPFPVPPGVQHFAPDGVSSHPTVALKSLRGVDCAFLTVCDVDLAGCKFVGAFHLDQIRLEGDWKLGTPPEGWFWSRGMPFRWTRRKVVQEERDWRQCDSRSALSSDSWGGVFDVTPAPGPAAIATIYRQLRKAREDSKDEPGAADFYYGEMEMRRHDCTWRQAERWLLQGYWALSGYGLRASRALGWLLLAMTATIALMMSTGIPDESPKHEVKQVRVQGQSRTVIDKPEPQLTLPIIKRFTAKRFEKSLRTVLNSVVFRSSGQDLTTWGTYTEMGCRFTEPVLLGFAALAVRGRVKRGN